MEIGLENIGMPIVIAELYPGSTRADNWRYEPDLAQSIVPFRHIWQHPLDQVQGIFGRGAISGGGPGPGSVPQNTVEGTVGGPSPGIFGRGTISGGGPGPGSVPQNTVEGTVGGPGPRGEIAPRPDYGWTKSTDALDLAQNSRFLSKKFLSL